ncbi:MAG: virulence factor BrkB family protein [Gammaproteobacteria bacterium]|jgi:membrane protein|nr:virulence factor BrkB family protein [Gammaproteobacteria bacterium]MBT7307063.1 virulence factor BrkB family protein [Gammaproteobacteria bacterium]
MTTKQLLAPTMEPQEPTEEGDSEAITEPHWQLWLNRSHDFAHFFIRKVGRDRIPLNAGSLSYMTILSLVPLLAVMLSVFSAFPVFDDFSGQLESFVFQNFVPAAGEQIQTSLQEFVENTKKMTALGVLFLVVVAMLLMAAVERTMSGIWENKQRRGWATAFMLYWSVLTLGPLLIGAGLAITSFLVTVAEESVIPGWGLQSGMLQLLPYITSILAFMMLYTLVPGRTVRFVHALSGAMVASILFEVSKSLFALYVASFPAYETLYGALAAVPILFIWVYLSWVVVLLGAEFTYCLGHYREEGEGAGTV